MRPLATIVAVVLAAAIAGCAPGVSGAIRNPPQHAVVKLYPGASRPPNELGVVTIANSQIDVDVRFVNGIRTRGKRVFHLPPGEAVFDVQCFRPQPRDPFGSWRGHEILRASIEAGHQYLLYTKTRGPGRAGIQKNDCTSHLKDRATGRTVSEVIGRP